MSINKGIPRADTKGNLTGRPDEEGEARVQVNTQTQKWWMWLYRRCQRRDLGTKVSRRES